MITGTDDELVADAIVREWPPGSLANALVHALRDARAANAELQRRLPFEEALRHLEGELHEARANAERYLWCKQAAPDTLCAIAWRAKTACIYGEPDGAIDAARKELPNGQH